MVAIFKNIWNTSATKNYYPVTLLFLVDKFFEKLVNNKVVFTLRNFAFFWSPVWFQVFSFNHNFDKNFWQGLTHWHSLKFGTLQSRSNCDQTSAFGRQLGAWSGLLISLLKKFNLFNLTIQLISFEQSNETRCYWCKNE